MHVASVSENQLARIRSALEHITPSASPNQLAGALELVVARMDELHGEGGPLAGVRPQWLRTRRAIEDLPEIHDRSQHSAIRAQLASAEIAELGSQLEIREGARNEVASIHANTMNTVYRECPLLLTIAALAAGSAVTFDLTWMLGIAAVPGCLLLVMGSLAFRSRLLLARLHNGVRAAAIDLGELEAVVAERASYEALLAQSFEAIRAALEKSVAKLQRVESQMDRN
jgi:hypothetical protein